MVVARNNIRHIRDIMIEEIGWEASMRIAKRLLLISRNTSFNETMQRLVEMLNEVKAPEPVGTLEIPKL